MNSYSMSLDEIDEVRDRWQPAAGSQLDSILARCTADIEARDAARQLARDYADSGNKLGSVPAPGTVDSIRVAAESVAVQELIASANANKARHADALSEHWAVAQLLISDLVSAELEQKRLTAALDKLSQETGVKITAARSRVVLITGARLGHEEGQKTAV